MKNLFILLFMILIPFCVKAQKIFSTQHGYQADFKVFVVDKDYNADIVVYRTDQEYKAKSSENKGIWYFCDREYQADKKYTLWIMNTKPT